MKVLFEHLVRKRANLFYNESEEIAHEIAQSHRTEIADFSVYAAANPLINEEQATNRAQR